MATKKTTTAPVMNEIASIERDVHRVVFGKLLRNEDETLLSRGGAKGLKIYDELKRDCHAGAVLAKRKLAVTSRPWSVEPASENPTDVAAAEMVKQAFEALRFNAVCKRLLDATLKGFSVAEVMWEVRDGLVLPADVRARSQRRFVFALDGKLRLLTREAPLEGEELPERKFIVHRYGGDDESPYGRGVGSMLFWPVLFKRQDITFWLTFADKFGSPTALGKYPNGASKDDQKKLLDALRAIAQDAGVIVPEGMLIELLEASRAGSVDTYEKLARYMDEQISKAVLGETMSTTAAATGLGSNQASVHNEVRLEVAADDDDELCETLNDSLVRWIVEYNMPQAALPKLKRSFEEPEDLKQRAERDAILVRMGWEPDEDYILETYGEGWSRKAPAELPAGAGLDGAGGPPAAGAPQADDEARFAERRDAALLARARAFNAERQQALTKAADQLAGRWREVMGPKVEQVLSVLDETGDLVQFRERMTRLLEREPRAAAVEWLARATFAGHVMGRGDRR